MTVCYLFWAEKPSPSSFSINRPPKICHARTVIQSLTVLVLYTVMSDIKSILHQTACALHGLTRIMQIRVQKLCFHILEKASVKTAIQWNIKISFLDFQLSLVSHDPSEIILICWKLSCCLVFLWKLWYFEIEHHAFIYGHIWSMEYLHAKREYSFIKINKTCSCTHAMI